MEARCPRCGARQELRTESRFYACHYCRSTFVISDGGKVAEYIADVSAEPEAAWSALHDFLEQNAYNGAFERINDSPVVLPFWLVRCQDGTTLFRPACHYAAPRLELVALPASDLVPVKDNSDYVLPDHTPETYLTETACGDAAMVSLVYLPLYLLKYAASGKEYVCTVSVADWRVYADVFPQNETMAIEPARIYFLAAYLVALVAVCMLISNMLFRGTAVLLLLVTAYIYARQCMLGREVDG